MLNHRSMAGRPATARIQHVAGPYLSRLTRRIEVGVRNPGGRRRTRTASSSDFLVSPFSQRERIQLRALVLLWACADSLLFWWWFQTDHVIDWPSYVIASLALIWVVCLPGYFFFFLLRARVPNPRVALPSRLRVAMVVTKAPCEPFSIVQQTLLGMLSQRYPHHTWLADEDPSPETLDWCKRHGVEVSCRKNDPEYQRSSWPRRKRCKEGNLAFFYDHFGYGEYDFVIQMDADHIPQEGYLEEMLRPFIDPEVGYVSAPSVCDTNAAESWSARARLYGEALFHGALQAGYTNGFAPVCIGSHYAVRTKALEEIGGLGPELAEDHSTTLFMNAAGWHGVHAIQARACGQGPQTFADMAVQEFQWSRSLVRILLFYTPRQLRKLPGRLKAQFLFSQFWYPMFSLSMLLLFTMPIIALVRGQAWVDIRFPEFIAYFGSTYLLSIAILFWTLNKRLGRPWKFGLFCWEAMLFPLLKWPWILLGFLLAVLDRLSGSDFDFKVTPKRDSHREKRGQHARFALPYIALSLTAILPVLLITQPGNSSGYYFFSTLNAFLYAICFTVIFAEGCWAKISRKQMNRGQLATAG
jgi:cellulose synthase/poly-beta-1,6-N-acetylglucosamine synthase-like glycosyltransferase